MTKKAESAPRHMVKQQLIMPTTLTDSLFLLMMTPTIMMTVVISPAKRSREQLPLSPIQQAVGKTSLFL